MKTNNKPAGPDIDSIISGLTSDKQKSTSKEPVSSFVPPQNSSAEMDTERDNNGYGGRLWTEFLEILNDPEEETDDNRTTKLYAIDDDIVETLHQCDFNGKPNVAVINSILRAFLIDNIETLKKMQLPRSMSLLDKY